MEPFDHLTDVNLTALAAALRSGRLVAPFTDVAVRRFCSTDRAETVAASLQHLHAEGMRPQHMAMLAETITRTRSRLPPADDVVDLVWTGPETPGLANRDTGVVVRDLFGAAEVEVLVAGFAVYQGHAVFKRLAERMVERPRLRVALYLNVSRPPTDSSSSDELLHRFGQRFRTQEWPGETVPDVYYDPRSLDPDAVKRSSLHAKCVIVDRRVAFITSANFTEAAQTRNIEVGALIRSTRLATQLVDHFAVLREAGMLKKLDLKVPPAA